MTDETRRKLYFSLLTELDDISGVALKQLIDKGKLSDLENYLSHSLNTILENDRVLVYSLTRNFSMTTGGCLRNLLENWANLAAVIRKPKRATLITKSAFEYAEILTKVVKKEASTKDLQNLRGLDGGISERVAKLGDAAEFQYELLNRYAHTDMWAAIHDVMIEKDKFWTSLLGWGLEFSMEALLLIDGNCELDTKLKDRIQSLNAEIIKAFVS